MIDVARILSFATRSRLVLVSVVLSGLAAAETEIHKCTDADGGVVYSQLPCAPDKPDDVEADDVEESSKSLPPGDVEEEFQVVQVEEGPPKSAEEVAACKKLYRDQIDAIDLEIQREYSEDKADDYKQRLLRLTRQLRQC